MNGNSDKQAIATSPDRHYSVPIDSGDLPMFDIQLLLLSAECCRAMTTRPAEVDEVVAAEEVRRHTACTRVSRCTRDAFPEAIDREFESHHQEFVDAPLHACPDVTWDLFRSVMRPIVRLYFEQEPRQQCEQFVAFSTELKRVSRFLKIQSRQNTRRVRARNLSELADAQQTNRTHDQHLDLQLVCGPCIRAHVALRPRCPNRTAGSLL